MSTLFKKVMVLISGILITTTANQKAYAQEKSLDDYITLAFTHNESLRQQQFQLEKALYALKEAQSLFLPTVSLLGTYTKAGGGRTIDFPVGDMLNPIYATLNDLTESDQFSSIENASILLNPDNFYDVKFRTTLPLINAEIWYNQKIKKELITKQEAALNVYKRHLVKDVKTAYFSYYQAGKAVNIYKSALEVIKENIRVNESLYANGVRNRTSLIRAQAEKEKIEASLNEANNKQKNARAYFNFLLNQPLDTPVTLDSALFIQPELLPVYSTAFTNREELTQLRAVHNAHQLNKNIQKAHLLPKVNTFLDIGSQGFEWTFDNSSRYYMWGVNLQWDLFGGNQYKYQIKQTEADLEIIESKTRDTEDALTLQTTQAYNNYNAAYVNYQNAQKQLMLAEKYYADQLKLYKAGQLLYIELLDAQNQITEAQLKQAVSMAQIQITLAELEHSMATYPL